MLEFLQMRKEKTKPEISPAERKVIYQPVEAATLAAEEAERAIIAARINLVLAVPELLEVLVESSCKVTKVFWQNEELPLNDFWLELELGGQTFFLYYHLNEYPTLGYTKGLTVVPRPVNQVPDYKDQGLAIMELDEWPRLDHNDPQYKIICGIALYDALPGLSRYFPMAIKNIEELIQSLAEQEIH